MPIANDIKNIAEGIEVSYGERAAFLSDLSKGTNETLKTFNREHQKMADDLRASLSTSERKRMKESAILIGDIKAAIKAIEEDTAETRAENVRDLKEMAHKLAQFLSSSETERKKEFASLLEEIKARVAEIEKNAAKMHSKFQSDHKEMAADLRSSLSNGEKERLSNSTHLFREIKVRVAGIEKDTANLLSGFAQDQREARTHWQNLAKVMVAKRAGKAVTVAKRIEGVPKEEVAQAVEAFTAGSLKEQIMGLVSETASGISLTKMGAALRIPYIRLAKPASDLVKEGKIKKEDSEYLKV